GLFQSMTPPPLTAPLFPYTTLFRSPRALPQPGLFRLRRLRRRSGSAALFRQVGEERHAAGGRDAGRSRQVAIAAGAEPQPRRRRDRKSTRLNSSHVKNSYAVFCLKK